MLADIRTDLEAFGVRFDIWFSEKSLLADGSVQKSIEELLRERGSAMKATAPSGSGLPPLGTIKTE